MQYSHLSLRAFFVCSLLLISSCGGGSGSATTPEPKPIPTPETYSLTGTPPVSVNENENYTFTVNSSGFTNASLTYSIENKPKWAEFDSATGEFLGTPSYDDAGEYNDILISASDGANSASLTSFSIEVINANQLPSLESEKYFELYEIEPLNITFKIKDLDNDELTISVSDLPNWLSFDEKSNSLSGSPGANDGGDTDAQTYFIKVLIDDGHESIVTETLEVIVYNNRDDADNDGIEDIEDAFPLDIAASIDRDLDGYPDSWNEGKTNSDSTTGLTIDNFPLEQECWLSSHALDSNHLACDYAATMPIFEPAQIIKDDNGNIYFLNTENNTVYRWLAEVNTYSEPIYLDQKKTITSITYSSAHNRLYVVYERISISYIDLDDLSSDQVFLTDSELNKLYPGNNKVYVAGNNLLIVSTSENLIYSYDIDAQLIDSTPYYYDALDGFTFDETIGIGYYTIYGRELYSHSISAEGFLGSVDSSYHYNRKVTTPFRLSQATSIILTASGYKIDLTDIDNSGQVLPNSVTDLQFFENEVATISSSSNEEETEVSFYRTDNYNLITQIYANGAPLALLAHEQGAVLITLDSETGLEITTLDLTDPDNDGLNTYIETNKLHSNPLLADSDADGLPDFYEFQNELLISTADAADDADNDGLSNIGEYNNGTDVHNSDSDNDGLTDGEEVNTYLTMPLNKDTDGDKIPDDWEVLYGLDPLDSLDAEVDGDYDTYSNLLEFYSGTSPINGADFPEVKPWNSFQGNADNAGYIDINVNADDLSLRWSTTLPNIAHSLSTNAVATQGKVITTYSSDYNKIAIALSAVDGSLQWQTLFGDIHEINSPSFLDDKVYLQAGGWSDSHLYGLNISNGSEVFATPYDNHYMSHEAPTIFNNNVYISAGSGPHKYDSETGTELWSDSFGYCEKWVPAVNDNSVYYFNGILNIANKQTGTVSQTSVGDVDYNDCSTPVLSHTNVFVISDSGLIAFDGTTADILWQINNENSYTEFTGTPVVRGGKVYTNYDGVLKVFNEYTGEELWYWDPDPNTSNELIYNIALTQNLAFVSDQRNTYAIDIITQQEVWSTPYSGQISLSVEGALYIQSNYGIVTAINIGGDTDNDGMSDWWEEFYGLDANNASDAPLNSDTDELTNLEEFNLGTNPLLNDSDSDGINDSDEVSVYLSDPTKADTDDDGMPDLWEVNQGFNLLDGEDAILDSDNDGATNVDEYLEATDPNADSSIPVALPNQSFSFEDNVIPADFIADDTMPSSWEASSLESYHGDFSLYSSAESAFEYTEYFQGTKFSYAAKTTCNKTYLKVYIDGQKQSSTDRLPTEWQVFELLIPKGRHTIRVETSGCSIYLDDVNFEPLENITSTNTFFVTTFDEMLNIFNLAGDLVRQVSIPEPENSARWVYRERDLTILEDGRVAIFNGTYNPSLSIYSPESNLWSHLSVDNWGTDLNASNIRDGQSGGIASNANTVFVTSMSVYDNHFGGIISFNLLDGSITKTKGKEYIDLTIGLDGFLYAMTGNVIDKYDLEDMALLMSYPISTARSVAADSQGNMYTASWSGILTHYNLFGQETNSIDTTTLTGNSYSDALFDIDINYDGKLFVSNERGQLLITDTNLAEVSFYQDNSDADKGDFLAILLTEADNDNDGIPGWWERLHGLSDDDNSDALTDLESDSVNNLAEYNAKSDPLKVDTDEDGLDDFVEIYDSLTSAILADSDNDGLEDINEINLHYTNPNDADSDGDLVNDGDEVTIYKTDPLDAKVVPIIDIVDFNDGIIPAEFTQIPSAGGEWLIEHNSLRSAKTPYGSASESSAINYSKSFSEGTLTFDAILKEDYCCGSLIVIVDGILILSESQSGTFSLDVDEDTDSIEFRYYAEELNSSEYNGVWIDNILFTPSH